MVIRVLLLSDDASVWFTVSFVHFGRMSTKIKMTPKMEKDCYDMIDRLLEKPCGKFFYEPYDTNNPDDGWAFSIVPDPISIKTIRERILSHDYVYFSHLRRDFVKIVRDNVLLYGENSPVTIFARELMRTFDKKSRTLFGDSPCTWTKIIYRKAAEIQGLFDTQPLEQKFYTSLVAYDTYSRMRHRKPTIFRLQTDDAQEGLSQLSPEMRSKIVRLMQALGELSAKHDAYMLGSIIRSTQPELIPDSDSLVIDMNDITEETFDRVKGYVKERLREMGMSYPKKID